MRILISLLGPVNKLPKLYLFVLYKSSIPSWRLYSLTISTWENVTFILLILTVFCFVSFRTCWPSRRELWSCLSVHYITWRISWFWYSTTWFKVSSSLPFIHYFSILRNKIYPYSYLIKTCAELFWFGNRFLQNPESNFTRLQSQELCFCRVPPSPFNQQTSIIK